MCGIVCIIRKDANKTLYKEHTDIFKQMLYADALRGWDSTGIASIRQTGHTHITKDACPPASLYHRVQDHTWIHNNIALIGHNRWATKGATNKENAHPFKEGHISLVHNGTLRFHHNIKNVEVDSHAITHSMVERGAKPTLEMLDGAYALVWFDENTGLIHAARNTERTLYLLETEEIFILSSEEKLAQWIVDRNGKKIKKSQILTPGLIYSFKTNKKDTRYVATEKFNILVYKPPKQEPLKLEKKETIDHKTGEVLQFPPKQVTKIEPYKRGEELDGIKKGTKLDVLMFKRTKLAYNAYGLGKYRWIADLPGHEDVIVEIYTDNEEDFTECSVTIEVDKLYWSAAMTKHFLIGFNPVIPQKKDADKNGPMRTSNGIELTDQVLSLCKGKYCEECTADFEAGPHITLKPITVNGHIYNYRYICADCTDYFRIMGRKTR